MKPTNKCELACLRNEVFPVFWERSYRTHTQQDRNPDAPYNASPRVSNFVSLIHPKMEFLSASSGTKAIISALLPLPAASYMRKISHVSWTYGAKTSLTWRNTRQ
jgi:hypothetical protein